MGRRAVPERFKLAGCKATKGLGALRSCDNEGLPLGAKRSFCWTFWKLDSGTFLDRLRRFRSISQVPSSNIQSFEGNVHWASGFSTGDGVGSFWEAWYSCGCFKGRPTGTPSVGVPFCSPHSYLDTHLGCWGGRRAEKSALTKRPEPLKTQEDSFEDA